MTAQDEFNRTYITSSEIGRRLGVTRTAIIQARRKGMLPDEIMVEEQLVIWRREAVEPHIAAWERKRNARLGVA